MRALGRFAAATIFLLERNPLSRIALLVSAAALLAAAPALAQTITADVAPPAAPADPVDLAKDTITIGAGAAYVPDYEGSNHHRVVPAPFATGSIKGRSFTLIGNQFFVNLIKPEPGPTWNIQAGPIGVVNFNRTSNNNISDPRVARLPERKTAIELGGFVGLSKTGVITSPYDQLTFQASLRHDVTGNNDSYVFSPSLTYLTPLSLKAAVILIASGSYVGTKYARYYYGVTAADSRASGLPVFTPSHDWSNYTLGALGTYSITGNLLHGFKLIAGGTYSREVGVAARTPLTSIAGNRNQFIGTAGVAYTF